MNHHYETVLNIVYEADMQPRPADSLKELTQNGSAIQTAITNLKKSGSWPLLGAVLCMVRDASDYGLLPVETFGPDRDICKNLAQNEQSIADAYADACRKRAEKLLEKALSGRDIKHTDRQRLIEKAIRLVMGVREKGKAAPTDSALIARCYLERSRLVLPKGSSLPEKKLEALEKAHAFARDAGCGPCDELFIQIAIEQLIWDERADRDSIKRMLETYVKSPGFSINTPFRAFAAGHARRLGLGDPKLDNCLLKHAIPGGGSRSPESVWLLLFKCEAALRTQNVSFACCIDELINTLRSTPFSSPLWAEAVAFFETIPGGSNKIIDLWRACKVREESTELSVQLRWYWARHQKLYEMAFLRALFKGDDRRAVEIADSLKSRPAVKMQAIEKSLAGSDKTRLDLLLEVEAAFASGGFSPEYKALVTKMRATRPAAVRKIDAVPAGWAAVHFYVTSREDCYAIVVHDDNWEHKGPFPVAGLQNAYRAWCAAGSNDSMKRLCDAGGEALDFLFDHPKDNLILIPHGFLHMIPLHAVCRNGSKYLFQEKRCLYLPSWSLAPVKAGAHNTNGSFLFKNYSDTAAFDSLLSLRGMVCTDYASFEGVRTKLQPANQPPNLLTVICHGQGDINNPYNSRLLLAGGGATHKDIRSGLPDIPGSRVILSACESDFTAGGIDLVDEHLSIASAFLSRGAREVACGLFKIEGSLCCDFIEAALGKPSEPLYAILACLQRKWLINNKDIRDIAPFRVVGFPE